MSSLTLHYTSHLLIVPKLIFAAICAVTISGGAGGGGTGSTLTPVDPINSLLLINPHAITYAIVEAFCPYRLG